jgi:hypothetical protein
MGTTDKPAGNIFEIGLGGLGKCTPRHSCFAGSNLAEVNDFFSGK